MDTTGKMWLKTLKVLIKTFNNSLNSLKIATAEEGLAVLKDIELAIFLNDIFIIDLRKYAKNLSSIFDFKKYIQDQLDIITGSKNSDEDASIATPKDYSKIFAIGLFKKQVAKYSRAPCWKKLHTKPNHKCDQCFLNEADEIEYGHIAQIAGKNNHRGMILLDLGTVIITYHVGGFLQFKGKICLEKEPPCKSYNLTSKSVCKVQQWIDENSGDWYRDDEFKSDANISAKDAIALFNEERIEFEQSPCWKRLTVDKTHRCKNCYIEFTDAVDGPNYRRICATNGNRGAIQLKVHKIIITYEVGGNLELWGPIHSSDEEEEDEEVEPGEVEESGYEEVSSSEEEETSFS